MLKIYKNKLKLYNSLFNFNNNQIHKINSHLRIYDGSLKLFNLNPKTRKPYGQIFVLDS